MEKDSNDKDEKEDVEEKNQADGMEKNNKKKSNKLILALSIIILILVIVVIVLFCVIINLINCDDCSEESSTRNSTGNYQIDIGGHNFSSMDFKPIIYLYPEEETEVLVKLGYPDNITVSYPEYSNGWNIIAQPDGTLLYEDKELYSLYYESENGEGYNIENEGFCVASYEVAEFLEEKLALLGLNEREIEEFIIYWLPKLQENEYNYIRFATEEEIESNMPLEISPMPDNVIRVLMTYKGLDEEVKVTEQKIKTPERTGFVAVEWGGTEIK